MLPLTIVIVFCTGTLASYPILFENVSISSIKCFNDSSPDSIIHLENVNLATYPDQMIENNTLTFVLHVLQPISGNQHKLNLSIKKKVVFGWNTVPCGLDIISWCTFDLCDILNGNSTNQCVLQQGSSLLNILCECPFQIGTYTIKTNSTYLQLLLKIGHRVHTTVKDITSNEEVACYDFHVPVDVP